MDGSLRTIEVACPYCGEYFETLLDSPTPGMSYIEDCQICCQPIEFVVGTQTDPITVETRRDDE